MSDNYHSTGIEIYRQGYTWSQAENGNFIIFVEYITNKSTTNYNNVYLGYYWDFDIPTSAYSDDMAGWIDSLDMGYMYDNGSSNLYIGGKFLGNTTGIGIHYYTNSNDPETDAAYYAALSDLTIPSTPPTVQNDYKVLSSTGPFTLNTGDTIVIAYGIAAGNGLDSLINTAVRMQELYDSNPLFVEENLISVTPENLFNLTPNPSFGQIRCSFKLLESSNVSLEVFDLQGRVIWSSGNIHADEGNNTITLDLTDLNNGIYFINMKSGEFSLSRRLTLIK